MIIFCTSNNKILFSMAETETHFQKGRDKKENYEEKEKQNVKHQFGERETRPLVEKQEISIPLAPLRCVHKSRSSSK
ncbi:hypothetical protein TNIN_365061 [Trichonephila inaurata madagascariensis]|uniref:Uncharacterized protein n=1 Tax=Trichonephila inaurata madagascariensis TaxID=2747483 RepID=A0A8X6YBQ5_9ARAC|nr:hypothetical protein TNIN_365061 [Trichonephila inaurata madagascariensis]